MIKATGRGGDGNPLLILGLSGENVTRLVAGEPIKFDTEGLGIPAMTVVILYGRTEADIVKNLDVKPFS